MADQCWESTSTAHSITRLLSFYRAIDATVSVCRERGEGKATWAAYIDDEPVQYGYQSAREALRAADHYRWMRAEHLRPDGWKPRQQRFVNVNAFDVWTPDDATRDSRDDRESMDAQLAWS